MMKLSGLLGLDVYSGGAKYVGKVCDVIVDLQAGEVSRLALQPMADSSRNSPEWFKANTLLYKRVKTVSDVVLISNEGAGKEQQETVVTPQQAPKARFFGARRT